MNIEMSKENDIILLEHDSIVISQPSSIVQSNGVEASQANANFHGFQVTETFVPYLDPFYELDGFF